MHEPRFRHGVSVRGRTCPAFAYAWDERGWSRSYHLGQHNEENVHNAEEADRSEVVERDQEVA